MPVVLLGLVGGAIALQAEAAEPGSVQTESDSSSRGWQKALRRVSKQAEADGKLVISGENGWLFFVPELRHLGAGPFWGPDAPRVSKASNPDWADPLPAIVDFHAQLRDAGIELLVVPVPGKAVVYPDQLPPNLRPGSSEADLDPDLKQFYVLLAKEGIRVLDLAPLMKRARDEQPRGPLYCREDTHWSGSGCVLAGQAIAGWIAERPWQKDLTRESFRAAWREESIHGDLRLMLQETSDRKESIVVRHVERADGEEVHPDRQSPILLLGDSHTLIFHAGEDMHARGAGLLEQLALEVGVVPDLIGVRGSGATPSRIALMRRGDNLRGKKLVIWVFSVREFTEGQGWRKVPVIR